MKKLLTIGVLCFGLASYCQTAEEFYKNGESKYRSKDYNGAIIEYKRAIELNPDYAYAYLKKGYSEFKRLYQCAS